VFKKDVSDDIHVCQIINSLDLGGAEHLLVNLTEEMEEVDLTVISLESEAALAEPLRDAGARIFHLEEAFKFDPRTFRALRGILTAEDFDIVHNHLPYAHTIGRIIARSTGHEVVVSTHHSVPANYNPVTRTTERLTRYLDTITIAVSRGVERAFTGSAHEPNVLGDDWCTIYNGIDVEGFRDAVERADGSGIRRSLGIDGSESVILNVGRYVPAKSQKDLIEAFALADLSKTVLVIVGHGPLKDELERTSEQFGVANRVYITDRVAQVEPYYAAADMFVSSSRREGLPMTILEAMAVKLPVIVSNIPAVNEVIIDENTGHLYPSGETEALANILSKFENDELEMYIESAYERTRTTFDIELTADTHKKLYRTLME
jgi:glycosyltransferase involved in cell wall biosynthesis